MKRFMEIILLMFFCMGIMTGCDHSISEKNQNQEKLNIVATDFAPYDFAKMVAGDAADVSMLLAPGEEAHSFEPTPRDMIQIQNCDIFVYTGGESDEWIDEILASMDREIVTVKLMDAVELYEEEIREGMENKESAHEHEEEEYDEHVWTAPANAIKITKALDKAFSRFDPDNKDKYNENAEGYILSLKELDEAFWNVVNHASRKTLIFGDRFPLRYFVEEYGLSYYAAFPGCASDTEPNAKTVAFLIDKVKKEKIPVVFHVEASNQNMTNTICEDTGAKNREFHACHIISKEEFAQGLGYLDFMWNNVEVLKEALE